ncbi:MAG TPA: alkaline phosphatase family protein, partial [Thermoanaerobaculia bacterium]
LVSHSTPLTDQVTLGDKAGNYTLRIVAVDGTDDGQANYDSLVIHFPSGSGGLARIPIRAGEWQRLIWRHTGRPTASWMKLTSLKPDLSETLLFIDGVFHTLAYPGKVADPLVQKGLYWPGPPNSFALASKWQGQPGIDLETWLEQAEHMTTFMGETLRIAASREDWDLLLGYIPVIDQSGHRLLLLDERQPGFSPERRDELARARTRVWQMVDAELRKLIDGLDLTRTTLVVLSDHGMAPVHTAIDPGVPLAELGLGPTAYTIGDGGVAYIHVENAPADGTLLADLARRYAEWQVKGEKPIEKVLNRQEAAQLGIDHPNSGDLVLFAREGYLFRPLTEGKASGPAPVYGAHGHLSTHPDMHAVYMAIGAGVKPGPGGTVRATEVAPRVSAWLGIDPPGPPGRK